MTLNIDTATWLCMNFSNVQLVFGINGGHRDTWSNDSKLNNEINVQSIVLWRKTLSQ